MRFRDILKGLDTVDAFVLVIVTVLTYVARIIAAPTALVAELSERLAEVGDDARASIADRVPTAGPVHVVTAVRTRDVPVWSTR
jgi:hypothetical protein